MTPPDSLPAAVGLAVVVTAIEYFFRHYVLFWLPTLGSLRVNDMLSLALAYSLLVMIVGTLTRIAWRRELAALGHALRDVATQWTYIPWILAMILSLVVLSALDQAPWGEARLPMRLSG